MNKIQPSTSFPSDTVKNPREDCKAITTRSGKMSQSKEGPKEQKPSADIEVEEVIMESSRTLQEPAVAQSGEKNTEDPEEVYIPPPSYRPPLPFPKRALKHNLNH